MIRSTCEWRRRGRKQHPSERLWSAPSMGLSGTGVPGLWIRLWPHTRPGEALLCLWWECLIRLVLFLQVVSARAGTEPKRIYRAFITNILCYDFIIITTLTTSHILIHQLIPLTSEITSLPFLMTFFLVWIKLFITFLIWKIITFNKMIHFYSLKNIIIIHGIFDVCFSWTFEFLLYILQLVSENI